MITFKYSRLINLFLLSLFLILSCNNSKKADNQTNQEPSSNKEFEELINTGREHLQNNQIILAIEAFNKATSLDSTKPDGHYGLGVSKAMLCYQNKIKCSEAIQHLEKTLSIEPNYRKALFNIGTCYISLGEYQKSIDYLNKAISNDTTNGEYYLNRGFAKLQLNDKDGACKDFHFALQHGYKKAEDLIKANCN